ncbi:MAG: glycosyltransferase, partial [Candidatus Sumerlaeia bacterium]|nr:glycosyltransferase [Candidatus Sumerlaeia bacterium]
LRAGLPVVSTPIGARGFHQGEEFGVLCAELEEFPQVMDGLMKDAKRRERVAKAARKAALDHYDWRSTLEPLHQLLREKGLTLSTTSPSEKAELDLEKAE